MIELCGLCGGELDNHDVRVTLQFAAGLRNGNHFLEVPHRLEDWPICWSCFTGLDCTVLRLALKDEYMEPVIERPVSGCRASCDGGVGRRRRFFGALQGRRGFPAAGKCPGCWGPVEVSIAGEKP